jgi:hypothetical protein
MEVETRDDAWECNDLRRRAHMQSSTRVQEEAYGWAGGYVGHTAVKARARLLPKKRSYLVASCVENTRAFAARSFLVF